VARVIVMADIETGEHTPILFDEQVCAIHVDDKHSAFQLIERLSWAIHDAEAIERDQQPAHEPGRSSRAQALGAGPLAEGVSA
jgi:hypothetical protein